MTKRYILKPGLHQFAPNSAAIHSNDNLTDEEAEWYLEKYPHIAILFEEVPKVGKTESPKVKEKKLQKSPVNKPCQINNSLTQ